ncbi:hypothetical protein E2C01_088179 [Portunus trituberculatus]|uniref:Uncharacterized protein n=1 Tax=Portunus trituberculatus TaxID=210409 RepID=A0A5B7JF95_PORTR|nr:hypothetical protein [Portunus trituberculatus]
MLSLPSLHCLLCISIAQVDVAAEGFSRHLASIRSPFLRPSAGEDLLGNSLRSLITEELANCSLGVLWMEDSEIKDGEKYYNHHKMRDIVLAASNSRQRLRYATHGIHRAKTADR